MDYVNALGPITTMATHLVQGAGLVGGAAIVINVLAAVVRAGR